MTPTTHRLSPLRVGATVNTVQATCSCGWAGTDMKGPFREDAARIQWESHRDSSPTTEEPTVTDNPRQSPEAREAQEELAAEKSHIRASRANAETVQRAQGRQMNAQANLLNALAWLVTIAWILAAIYVLGVVL